MLKSRERKRYDKLSGKQDEYGRETMNQTQWAVLFDLDQTLVLTAALLPLRQQQRWEEIKMLLHLAVLPQGTREFLNQVREIAVLGVVTSALRSYAEDVLAYHQLALPVLVAYEDTEHHKPRPDPLLKALALLGLPASRSLYVGDTREDMLAATEAGLLPLGLCWDDSGQDLPAAFPTCSSWDDVLVCLRLAREREMPPAALLGQAGEEKML
jgi:HAD superfamily hydrolase (TIGR01549 family)